MDNRRLRRFVREELAEAGRLEREGRVNDAFARLERAHILSQYSTRDHVAVHVAMLCWAWRQGSGREMFGQVVRIIGAATKTAVGWIPEGNTGGAEVSPFRPMPVPDDLAAIIARSRD
ncbi:DUF3703 domain-containing protein [Aurantiacibacter zhengii]|uniref:DUF3703 domain-containing protein n=1 Tax=Aurantiacibacter zhengii TaxID=2307003 RepID=A0A418NWQ5_9SPHN|nr:DUF3703 domain-containing protein [Aurantiacibacter zhengii]RIV89033.1 DUF3703 domain-containing protein [Aurantiacibacter zhengii]